MATVNKRGLRWHWAALLLGTLWMSVGCSPATLSALLMPFSDDRVQPPCKLASKNNKEVTVCVVCNFASLETRSDIIPTENELAELVAQQLRKRTLENKEKVKVVPPSKSRSLQQAVGGRSLHEVGKQCQADYVIALEIQEMSLYEKSSYQQLYRGNMDLLVRVIDVKQPVSEGALFTKPYRGESRNPIDASDVSILQFRTQFLNKVAADVARFFTPYPRDDRMRMEN